MIHLDLVDAAIRQQVYLEQIKASENKQVAVFLKDMQKTLQARLLLVEGEDLQRLETLMGSIDGLLNETFGRYTRELSERLRGVADYAAETEARDIGAILADIETVTPASTQVWAAVTANPISAKNYRGVLLEPFLADWSKRDVERLSGTIRQAFFEGRTVAEVVRELRGTKANRYTDGAMATIARHAEAVTHTAIQHVAAQARQKTWEENGDVVRGLRWVSTLDGRTSQVCRSMDGREFDIYEGPRPPIHIKCRSTTVAVLDGDLAFLSEGRTRSSADGYVDADKQYYDWLAEQVPEFQDEALGPTRAKLFRDGGLSRERFSALQLDKNHRPRTLEEIRAIEGAAWRRAFDGEARQAVASNSAQIVPDAFSTMPNLSADKISEALESIPGAADRLAKVREFIDAKSIKTVVVNQTQMQQGSKASKAIYDAVMAYLPAAQRDIGRYNYSIRNAARVGGFTSYQFGHITVKGAADTIIDPDTGKKAKELVRQATQGRRKWTVSSIAPKGSGEEFMTVWLHELGHQVHYWAGAGRYEGKYMTRYSLANHYEYHAEHFVAWLLDREAFAEFDSVSAEYFDKLIDQAIRSEKKDQ